MSAQDDRTCRGSRRLDSDTNPSVRTDAGVTGCRLPAASWRRQFFAAALALLADPQGFYQRGSGTVKRAMTKVIFSKLYVGAEQIAGHELTEAFDHVADADLLDMVLSDHGSK
jgi:hypothetical protein